MEWEDIQGKKYPGYGRCIYCGSDGGAEGLHDEHILPFSLGGNTEIKDANCNVCRRMIDPIDRHLGRDVYGQFRIHANIQTNHPEERPTVLPASFTIGGKEVSLNLSIKDHPYSLAMPIWGDAGFLRSAPIDSPFPEPYWHFYHHEPPHLRKMLGVTDDPTFKIWSSGHCDRVLLARALAKIAYCHAVRKFGLYGFRPLALPDIIRGQFSSISYFVGGPLTIPPPPFEKGMRHAILFNEMDVNPAHPNAIGASLKLHLAFIRLFADSAHEQHGMPIYHVVVGVRGSRKVNPQRQPIVTPRVMYLESP